MNDKIGELSNGAEFDFFPIGQAIKKAREAKNISREALAEQLDISSRHIQALENDGGHPSFKLFTQLVTMFDILVDQYIFPDKKTNKSTLRRQVDSLLDTLDDKELSVIEGTAKGLCKAKEQTEE